MQGELPTLLAILTRRFFGGFEYILGDAEQLSTVGDQRRKRIGCVEQILGKLGLERYKFFLDFAKAWLVPGLQFGSSKTIIAQVVLDDLALGLRQLLKTHRSAQGLEFFIELKVLRELGTVPSDFRQIRVVGVADRGAVVHRVQVSDHAPSAP